MRPKPTGDPALSQALGLGGWPPGRLVEIYGPADSGRKEVVLRSIHAVQLAEGSAAWIDADGQFDPRRADHVGIDRSRLLLAVPETGEQALQLLADAVTSGIDLVALVSAPSAVPQRAQREPMGSGDDVGQGRLWSHALRVILARAQRTGTTILVVNQERHVLADARSPLRDWRRTAIGAPIAYYAAVRLQTGHEQRGYYFRIEYDENGPPGRTGWMEDRRAEERDSGETQGGGEGSE